LLDQVRTTARDAGFPVRVIRRDTVPGCGPVGGVLTALKSSRAAAILFLACDMPFVTPEVLRAVVRASRDAEPDPWPVFVTSSEGCGFPFIVPRNRVRLVERQVERGEFSLRRLAMASGAILLAAPKRWYSLLGNINTPQDWSQVLCRKAR